VGQINVVGVDAMTHNSLFEDSKNFDQTIKEYVDYAKKNSEQTFIDACRGKGLLAQEATKKQDMHEHWDVKVTNPKTKKTYLVDVKGVRSKKRSSPPNYNITWLEYKNTYGNNGSLLGKADDIAFEQRDHFLICNRKDLINWLDAKITNKDLVYNVKDADYRLYQRKDRKDQITRVSIQDIKNEVNCRILNYT